jgi:hypothetical protein
MVDQSGELTSILSQASDVDLGEFLGTGVIDTSMASEMSKHVAGVEILNDEPTVDDAFGFHLIARTLANIILSPATQTPLSIGLDGQWGTGKTSLLMMVERLVRVEKIPCLWLNAWSLESTESMIASLGSAIQGELGRNSNSRIPDLVTRWLGEVVSYALPTLGGAIKVKSAVDEQKKKVRELASVVTARRSFEELIEALLKASKSSRYRLVVFIDDLDRAMPEQVAAMLRHLKLILEARGCIFILAMDMQIVARSIETHYAKPSPAEPEFGARFLEKLLQIAIQVPPLTRAGVESYLDQLGIADEVQQIIQWAPAAEVCNPRRLKRYLNWLSISLQFIRSLRPPKNVGSAMALRLIALKRDWPELFHDREFSEARVEDLSNRLGGDSERELGFRQYLRAIEPPEIEAFERFLTDHPLLTSALNFRYRTRERSRKFGGDDMAEIYLRTLRQKGTYSGREKMTASERDSLRDAVEAGRQAYIDAIREAEPLREE